MIGAINQTGLSLAVSGQIAFWTPFHSVLYEIINSVRMIRAAGAADAQIGVPSPARERPDEWFSARGPAQVDPETDWLVQIYDNRFVGICYQAEDEPVIFGDLREERASFVAWRPLHRGAQFERSAIARLAQERLPSPNRFADFVADWEDPGKSRKELKQLGYQFEERAATDPIRLAADVSVGNPITITTINVSLAIRKALRRYLGLEPTA